MALFLRSQSSPFSPPFPSPPRRRLRRGLFRVAATAGAQDDDESQKPWLHNLSSSFRRSSGRFLSGFGDYIKRDTGVDVDKATARAAELLGAAGRAADEARVGGMELLREFAEWNELENWKDLRKWEPRRIGAFVLYSIILTASCRMFYVTCTSFVDRQRKKELTEAYMEALIPEPSPANIRRYKKGLWRKTMPKGLKMKKFVEGPGGQLIQDESYVGEDAWDDESETPQDTASKIIDADPNLALEEKRKIKGDLGISVGGLETADTWQERLGKWKEILRRDKLLEQVDSLSARYVVDFDMKEVEKSLRTEVEKKSDTEGSRALWVSKRWWLYRPKLPYMYFLNKLDCSEVAAVVFTEDLKKVYVTMKEGFPLEYIVNIPLDPHLFEVISSSGAEVDLLQKRQIDYLLKVVIALVPGLLILYLIKESMMLLHIMSSRYLYKKYNQLYDMAYAENFILPIETSEEQKAIYKEVILGGDVRDLLDEIMIYMNNPMQYYEKNVAFVRGILLSGPPGTGKTLCKDTFKEKWHAFCFCFWC